MLRFPKRIFTEKLIQKRKAEIPELMENVICSDDDLDKKEELSSNQTYENIDLLLKQSPYMTHLKAMELLEKFPLDKALKKAKREPNPSRKPITNQMIKLIGYPEESEKRVRKATEKAQEAMEQAEKENAQPKAKKSKKE